MTKVVASTIAVMQQVDAGRLRLDDPRGQILAEFAPLGQGAAAHPATHDPHLGVRADVSFRNGWSNYQGAMAAIATDAPINPPGDRLPLQRRQFLSAWGSSCTGSSRGSR